MIIYGVGYLPAGCCRDTPELGVVCETGGTGCIGVGLLCVAIGTVVMTWDGPGAVERAGWLNKTGHASSEERRYTLGLHLVVTYL